MLMADMSIRFLSAEYIDKREKKIKNISSTPKREKLKNIFSVVNKSEDVNANVSFFVIFNVIKYTITSEDIPWMRLNMRQPNGLSPNITIPEAINNCPKGGCSNLSYVVDERKSLAADTYHTSSNNNSVYTVSKGKARLTNNIKGMIILKCFISLYDSFKIIHQI
jgi:hypothetical protein